MDDYPLMFWIGLFMFVTGVATWVVSSIVLNEAREALRSAKRIYEETDAIWNMAAKERDDG